MNRPIYLHLGPASSVTLTVWRSDEANGGRCADRPAKRKVPSKKAKRKTMRRKVKRKPLRKKERRVELR